MFYFKICKGLGLTTYAELDDTHIILDDIYDCILAKVISCDVSHILLHMLPII